MKVCFKCKLEKPFMDFNRLNRNKDKHGSYCKKCRSNYYQRNKEELIEKSKKNYYNDRENILKRCAVYRNNNKEKIAKCNKNYYNDNINRRIAVHLRCRITRVLKRKTKTGSAVKDLGCNLTFLIWHLESQFYPHSKTEEQMSWNNYGQYGWHIDHIKPLKLFDLTDRSQFLEAVHYSNLQPMWAEENLSKGSKY